MGDQQSYVSIDPLKLNTFYMTIKIKDDQSVNFHFHIAHAKHNLINRVTNTDGKDRRKKSQAAEEDKKERCLLFQITLS